MNKLTVVVEKLIYKRYTSADICEKEFSAHQQFERMVPDITPSLLIKRNNLCVYEYLSQGMAVITKRDASHFAALVMVNIFNSYNPTEYKKGSSWKLSLERLISDFISVQVKMQELNSESEFETLKDKLQIISQTKFTNITFLHRDIHKGNILMNNGQFYLIDYEHAMEGPIELELQNSLFWKDRMSINTANVINHLYQAGIKYSSEHETLLNSYYLADQIVIAFKDSSPHKVKKLLKRAKTNGFI